MRSDPSLFTSSMDKRVTLRDIARATGVHFTTVGLALRNDPRISRETAEKVQTAATKLGYSHDAMLSALSTYRHRDSHRFAGVIAYIVTYRPEENLKINLTERKVVEAATASALAQNFSLESFQINAPGMTAARMDQMLRARGIQGVILSPRLPAPGPMPQLDWRHFSPVALGYSITDLSVHRVCAHHAHNMRVCLREMRNRGYKRIGLVYPREIYERSRGLVLGAYLAEQAILPVEEQVTPLFLPESLITKDVLAKWLREQKIDGVILSAMPLDIQAMIQALGYQVPDQLGIGLICRYGKTEDIAGIDEQMTLLGEAAVDAVISLVRRNEKGLPAYPRYTLIEGRWVDRPTLRPAVTTA